MRSRRLAVLLTTLSVIGGVMLLPGTASAANFTTTITCTSATTCGTPTTQPTPAQDASHSANGVMFQDDPDSSTADIQASFISWQPAQATSTLPGYGFSRLRGPVVSHFNVYNVNPPPVGPTAIDPAHPLYQSLKTGVLNILDQQTQFDANPTGWPVFATPDAFVG